MKILAIRIKNLASLEGIIEIEFTKEPLLSAGIFAITGPTGSGKSTILDALCLALYAKTPRYVQARETGVQVEDVPGNTISQSDVRAILRDGTAEGFSEVDFVGVDGLLYRATWRVRRARNRADGVLQQASMALFNLSTESDIGGTNTELLYEITRLVGLNYEQFTRSVLLAQGDFTAFLKADKDEKASLLEKLTGTHIYSTLSRKIFERHREEYQKLKLLQQSREGIHTLTTEELEVLKQQEVSSAERLKTLDEQITSTAKEIEWYEALYSYQSLVAEAQQAYEAAKADQLGAAERTRYLQQVESVQSTRSSVDALNEAAEQLAQRQVDLEDTSARQQLLDQQLKETEDHLLAANQRLEAVTKEQEAAKPLLDEAKKLDAQLLAKEEEVVRAQQVLEIRVGKQKAGQERLLQVEQEQERLEIQITNLQNWKEKHQSRQPIAENHTLIVTRLDEASKYLASLSRAENELNRCAEDLLKKEEEHSGFARQASQLQQQVDEITEQLGAVTEQLDSFPVEKLRGQSKSIIGESEALLLAGAAWKQVYQTQQEYQALYDQSLSVQQQLTTKEEQMNTVGPALQALIQQRKASLSMLEKATIAASESVEVLREQLIDGQPCLVCGSAVHPYAHENPQLNHVLHELRQGHESLEQTHDEQQTLYSQLSQGIQLLKNNLSEVAQQLQDKQAMIDRYTANWESYPISMECSAIESAEKERWLTNRRQDLLQQQQALSDQLEQYEGLQKDAEIFRQRLTALQSEHHSTTNTVKDLERSIQALREQGEQARKVHSTDTSYLNDIAATLQPYFPDQQWIDNWKKTPEQFLPTLDKFANEWQETVAKLEQNTRQYQVAEATLSGMRKEQQTLDSDSVDARKDLTDKQDLLTSLQQTRQALFDGESVTSVEVRFREQFAQAQEQLRIYKDSHDSLKTESAKVVTTISQVKVEVSRLEKRIREHLERITQWLDEFNAAQGITLDLDGIKELLDHSTEWITNERAALAAIDRAITQAHTVLAERTGQLARHEQQRPSDQSLEDLQVFVDSLKNQRFESLREHNEIGYKIKQDEALKQQLGDLVAQMHAQAAVVDQWSKLNEMIGSADGKKFRQVAQEYTLDVLLGYANVQLEVLAQRYRLQRISGTLSLQVLDQDMGDEVRTVYSLSGGESFLVSLALALGLASLSASRMQVESLFIDEGFGSLDPTTLNIAMDALERLHNQGRKVGVISHVEEMTERIPVQIKVSKQQSGRSGVEVVGL